MSDIFFGGSPDGTNDRLTIQCATMWSQAHDFLLDSPARRKQGDVQGLRRALVHDQADGLTVNYNHDYPGGVTLNGPVTVTGDFNLLVNTRTITAARPGFKIVSESVKLGDVIGVLRSQIADLEARVAKLEAK